MNSQPRFLQGAFSFEGRGLTEPVALDGGLAYTVPSDRRAQLVYFRGGNSSAELIYALLARDGEPMRYFPIGARAACHVPCGWSRTWRPTPSSPSFSPRPSR